MMATNENNPSFLDNLRLRRGEDRLRQAFRDLAARDGQRAARHLNDSRLQFPTLFILIPEIDSLDLYEQLNARNIAALRLCAKKTGNAPLASRLEQLLPREGQTAGPLKWLFLTGLDWDGPSEGYDWFDAVMDAAAALLIRTYHDASVLPAVAGLIFRRNRKGLLIHDLVWCFFQSYDPDALKLIARYLLSGNAKNVELACTLLHIAMPEGRASGAVRQRLHRQYLAWLGENKPYLQFTGEHFQQTSAPDPLRVDEEAKYLGKPISPKSGKPLEPLTQDENTCLSRFRETPAHDRALLSAYSARIHQRSARQWQEWMKRNPAEQVIAAKSEMQVV